MRAPITYHALRDGAAAVELALRLGRQSAYDAAYVQRNALAPSPGRVLVCDRGGDVLLEVAGSAGSEVDFHDVAVEGRDGGDEPSGRRRR